MKKAMFSLKFVGGILLFVAGIGIVLFGNSLQNPVIIVVGLPVAAVGGYLVKTSFNLGSQTSGSVKKKDRTGKELKPEDNTLLISKAGIEWSQVDNPGVIPMRCRNNGREYQVLKQVGENTELLMIPDALEHYDPAEYGTVLSMPAHKKLFEKRKSLMEHLAPFALVVAMAVVAILMLVTIG